MDGTAYIEPLAGNPYSFYAGDFIMQARGYDGAWTINAGEEQHLELALVAKQRADSTVFSPMDRPFAFDRATLSGVFPDGSGSSVQLYHGGELEAHVIKRGQSWSFSSREKLIHVLNGIVTSEVGDPEQTYYPGDFFVVPENYQGKWKSKGSQPVRTLEIGTVTQKHERNIPWQSHRPV